MGSLKRNRLAAAVGVGLVAGVLGWYWHELSPPLRGALLAVVAFLSVTLVSRPGSGLPRPEPAPRLDIVERVVADESRRP